MVDKKYKRMIVIAIIAILILVTLILFAIANYKKNENTHLSYDKETGVIYVNNEVVLVMDDNVSDICAKTLINEYWNAAIDDSLSDSGAYRLIFGHKMSYKELQDIATEAKQYIIVEDAYPTILSDEN